MCPQASTPIQQLELITDLLGSPSAEDMSTVCQGARQHMMRRPYKPAALHVLYSLSSQTSPDAVHLLAQMLAFSPVRDRAKTAGRGGGGWGVEKVGRDRDLEMKEEEFRNLDWMIEKLGSRQRPGKTEREGGGRRGRHA